MTVTAKVGKPSLERFRRDLHLIEEDVKDVCADLTPEQLVQPSSRGGWSVQECLRHLNVTGELYVEKLESVISAARANGETDKEPFRYGFLGGLFIYSQEPPVRLKVKTFEVFQPTQASDERVLPTFLTLQEKLRDLLQRADGLPLDKLRIASPESKWLKMSVFEAFGLVLAHERRHLWQARQVRAELV